MTHIKPITPSDALRVVEGHKIPDFVLDAANQLILTSMHKADDNHRYEASIDYVHLSKRIFERWEAVSEAKELRHDEPPFKASPDQMEVVGANGWFDAVRNIYASLGWAVSDGEKHDHFVFGFQLGQPLPSDKLRTCKLKEVFVRGNETPVEIWVPLPEVQQ